jgi:hypothetical protein
MRAEWAPISANYQQCIECGRTRHMPESPDAPSERSHDCEQDPPTLADQAVAWNFGGTDGGAA